MAKKLVKYAFGSPQRYASIAKKDDYTVYFVYDTVTDEITGKEVPGKYGTIYKGNTRIGSACASDIVFDKELEVVILEGATPEDSVIVKIEPGTSLADYAEMALKYSANLVEGLRSEFLGDGASNMGVIYEILTQESEFDGNGTGIGIISNAINVGIANAIDTNGTVTSYLEENYVSKSNLGRIEELANILDEDTLDTLIAAASDIQGVLSNYYDKEDTSTLFREVIVEDDSTGFPEIGNENKLYISKDDNYMYRWSSYYVDSSLEGGDPELVHSYVLVSGGGDAANVEIKTNVYIKDNAISVSIAKGTGYTVQYAFSSANTYKQYHPVHGFQEVKQQIGSVGNVSFYLDGALIGAGNCIAANYYDAPEDAHKNVYNTFTIPAVRFTGSTHVLTIRATDNEGNVSNDATVTINIVNVSITSSFVANPVSLDNSLEVPVTVASSNPVTVWYKLDDEEPVIHTTTSGVTRETVTISVLPFADETHTTKRDHGIHTIDVWATATIAETGDVLTSAHLTWEFIWYDALNPTPIVSFVCLDDVNTEGNYEVTQYEYSTFKYQVYPRSNIRLMCKKLADPAIPMSTDVETEVLSLTNVSTVAHNWSYIFNESGVYEMYAFISNDNTTSDVKSDTFTINVKESAYAMNPVSGAMLYMSAQNHSNSGEHAWHSDIHTDKNTGVSKPPINAVLTNFAWNENSGWYTDPTDNITTSLRVGGGAMCEIPFTPFGYDYSNTGMTFELDFSTSRLSNSEAKVIECYSGNDKIGVTISATGAYWETSDNQQVSAEGDGRMHVPFREGERVRLSFVMTPMNSDDAGNATHDASVWQGESGSGSYSTVETVENGYWRFLKIYVNGICSCITKYKSPGGGIQQSTPARILIGSDAATVDIYNIRVYPKVLYDKDIVDNFIADTQNTSDKIKLFLRNNILNAEGTEIDAVRLSHQLPCMYITCESTTSASGFTNDEHILPMNKKDKRGYTVIYDCENLDEEYKEKFSWAKSFIAFNAQMCVQGTSSQYYPRKNYKLTFKPYKLKSDQKMTPETYTTKICMDSQNSKPTLLYAGTTGLPYEAGSGVSGEDHVISHIETDSVNDTYTTKYKLREFDSDVEKTDLNHVSSINATKYCLKADFMESSSVHNTGLAKYADFLLKKNGEKYLTPPQLAQFKASTKSAANAINDIDIRTTVDGYPCAIFWRKSYDDTYTFLGKYNFNFDKGAEEVFGFIGSDVEDLENPFTGHNFSTFNEDYYDAIPDPLERKEYESPVECWEFTNNTTEICKFKNVGSDAFTKLTEQNDSGTTKMVPDWIESFEARHPDNDTLVSDIESGNWVPKHFADFCKWVSDTDTKGFHNPDTRQYPIPTAWNGTVEDLDAGSKTSVPYISIDSTYENLLALHEAGEDSAYIILDETAGIYRVVVLEPKHLARVSEEYGNTVITPVPAEELAILTQEEIDELILNGDGDIEYRYVNNTNYDKFGYTVTYDAETNTWGEATPMVEETLAVDKTRAYYISKQGDVNFNKVYQYVITNTSTNEGEWQNFASLPVEYALPSPVKYGSTTYNYDTAEYRLDKFRNELSDHMNVDFTIAYYIISEFFCCSDQRAKNMMFASWGYEPERYGYSVKEADEYDSVEDADAAGYKPVYSYEAVVDDEELPEDQQTMVTQKTVLYYVPKACKYIYYPIFYDNDTILGVNNSGYLVFNPDIESTDTVKTGNAFNGGDSVLWLNLKDAFAGEIASTYANMRKNGLTYQDAINFFTNTQSDAWSESIYNMDAKFKYVEPATIGYTDFSKKDGEGNQGVNVHDDYYLFECQGSRATHRAWWLANRFTYMDSRYDCGDYHDSFAVFRIYTNLAEGTYNFNYQPDSTFYLTPYTDMYLRVLFGSRTAVVRAKKNTEYALNTGTNDKYNDTETMVFGASNILSYGDLTRKYVKNCNIGPSSKITEFKLGEESPYFNDNVENVSFNAANTALKNVDIRNCRGLSVLSGLEHIPSIERFYGTGTALSRVDFDEEGSNLKYVSYPSSITALKLIKMPFITKNNIVFESKARISSVWIEECENLRGVDGQTLVFSILNESQYLSSIRLVDINWNVSTTQEFNRFKSLINKRGMNERGSTEYDAPYISGTVTLGSGISISDGFKEGLSAYIAANAGGAQLTILGGNVIPLSAVSISVEHTETGRELDIDNFRMTSGVDYTFTAHYSPDDFITTRGVVWSYNDSHLVEVSRTSESITLRYTGSTSGNTAFNLTATSIVDNSKYKTAVIYPNPTLSTISLMIGGQTYMRGSTYSVYEGEDITIQLGFTPNDTTDKNVIVEIEGTQYFELQPNNNYYEYSPSSNEIHLTTGNVGETSNAVLRVISTDVPEISTYINISVLNKVSRIIRFYDATSGKTNANLISGRAQVRIIDDNAGEYNGRTYTVYTGTSGNTLGVISLPTNELDLTDETNPKFGKLKLGLTGIANDSASRLYSTPAEIILPAIVTNDRDLEYSVYFYEPVECTFTLKNGGKVINDPSIFFNIKDLTHTAVGYPGLENNISVYNGHNPVTMNMLADITHNIEIYQVASADSNVELTNNVIYSKYIASLDVKDAPKEFTINLSRDYLNGVSNVKDTELHMVVVTGSGNYRTIRLYVNISGPVVINWGDNTTTALAPGEGSYQPSGNPQSSVPVISGREFMIYHEYPESNSEYEITVQTTGTSTSELSNLYWLHVISSNDTEMQACFSTSPTADFKWTGDSAEGGLVGYLCCGDAILYSRKNIAEAANLTTNKQSCLRFNFSAANKKYSKLICVGDVYKNIGDELTTAEKLFENSTLEQLPQDAIFRENPNITSFKRCFANTNITRLADNFFDNNPNATNFEEMCKNCQFLFTMGTTEDSSFINVQNLIDIESIGGMFSGCVELTGKAPRLWERYFGDCFLDSSKNQGNGSHSLEAPFKDCDKLENIDEIPLSWGGYNVNWQISAHDIALSYIEPITGSNSYSDLSNHAGVRVDMDDITISNKDSFELIITPIGKYPIEIDPNSIGGGFTAYEPAFIFGAARYDETMSQDPQREQEGDYEHITNVIDFSWNGGPGTKASGYTGAIRFRNGKEEQISNLPPAPPTYANIDQTDGITVPSTPGGNDDILFPYPTKYPNATSWSDRMDPELYKCQPVKISIGRDSEHSTVVVKTLDKSLPLDSNAQNSIQGKTLTGYLNHYVDYANDDEVVSNTPLRLFSSYKVMINQIRYEFDYDGNKTWTNDHITYRFHELSIYDHNGNLKHHLVPKYGKTDQSGNSTWKAHIHDTVTGRRYSFTGGKNDPTRALRYYRKDHNLFENTQN